MWPRTAEERARNRNTGFVCFMTRIDAVEAMDAFQDGDPFGNGRNMVLRWGKNVKKTVKRGTGGVPIPPIARKKKEKKAEQMKQDNIESLSETSCGLTTYEANNRSGVTSRGDEIMFGQKSDSNIINMHAASSVSGILNGASVSTTPQVLYDQKKHEADAIKVLVPSDLKRVHFISKVASFVAKDGSLLEKKLIEKEVGNHLFSFLTPFESGSSVGSRMLGASASSNDDLETRATSKLERTFYRWRVYSFCQGDGLNAWRTEPFRMFYPDGAWWIPPPKDQVAARLEQELIQKKEHEILTKKEERRKLNEKKDFMTGRQLEHAKFGSVPGEGVAPGDMAKINDWEREQLDGLIGKLCASRDSICEAMAFCFDKSAAAVQISKVLKKSLLESGKSVSIDTRIARLFLLSDVLFNSQQPGVRNAFRYRDAVEEMAPEVFLSLGKHGGTAGRMTMNKLRRAVTNILSAWSNWSVYNPGFLDGLQARFEGKEIIVNNDILSSPDDVGNTANEVQSKPDNENNDIASQIVVKPAEKRGGWTEAKVDSRNNQFNNDGENGGSINIDVDGEPLNDDDVDGEALDDGDIDVDGESLADDEIDELDGEPISDEEM